MNRLQQVVDEVKEGRCPHCHNLIAEYKDAWECNSCCFSITKQQAEECLKQEDTYPQKLSPTDVFYVWLEEWRKPE